MCPVCREVKSKVMEVGVVDECKAHLTFMQETGVCLLSQNFFVFINNDLSLTIF